MLRGEGRRKGEVVVVVVGSLADRRGLRNCGLPPPPPMSGRFASSWLGGPFFEQCLGPGQNRLIVEALRP